MARTAEDSIQAVFQTQSATIKFIDLNNGKWPSSWDDLALVEPGRDFEWVATQIDFDFDADPATLAKLTPEQFEAIKQKTEYYNVDPEIQTIINRLQKYHPAQ